MSLFQSESKCETFHMKMSSTRSFFFMQIKVIFIRMAQENSEMAYYKNMVIAFTRTVAAFVLFQQVVLHRFLSVKRLGSASFKDSVTA